MTPPAGTQHYADFERKDSCTAIATGVLVAAAVIGACAWLLVMRSCDPATCAAAWIL